MKFRDLKLGTKLALGFGVLIVISMLLGGVAVSNMSRVTNESKTLAEEYVPEVKVANSIERNYLEMMFEMRGYSYSEEEIFLEKGKAKLNDVEKFLEEATHLADRSSHLVQLKEKIQGTKEAVENYKQLSDETEELNIRIASLRDNMDVEASSFMDNCNKYLENQNKSMLREAGSGGSIIAERLNKITWINDIIDKGNTVRVANFKSQATRNPVSYESAINEFIIADEIARLRRITRMAADRSSLDEIERAANDYRQAMGAFLSTWKSREDKNAERVEAALIALENSKTISIAGIEQTQQVANDAISILRSSNTTMLLGLFVALIIGTAFAIILTRAITGPVNKGVIFAKLLSEGDLTASIDVNQKDEIGQLALALTSMGAKLREIVESVISGAENIASASQQMSSTSQEMSQGANEQASAVEEVSSSMEEMAANIQNNTDNAKQTEQIAINSSKGIQDGSIATNTAVESMKNIAEKIKIINDIAFQTNILALNAAVEAARAGEHGKGFAVVAAEVRKLAERSKLSADEIDELSRNGVDVAEMAGKQLEEIVPDIQKTAQLVQEIASASLEQNSGADQITNAMQQLNNVTQQNAAASEEMATSSEELAGQAEQLKDTISFFKIGKGLNLKISTSTELQRLDS